MVDVRDGGHSVPGLRMLRIPVRPVWLGVIMVGGTVGTAVRAALESAWPAVPGQWPWTTFWINLSGALVLGALLEVLAASGPDRGWRRGLRLGVGTGVLGGYTTYSTFSVETVSLVRSGALPVGVGYALASVVIGVGLAYLGARAARRLMRAARRARGGIR
ncbi:FluC/FEX family fluoride channel [Propionicimonas sp.]|uniref:FluC/FEX family fluoride channel n=1 Tax=Propionicimonas sp. TaxID=1955623 RepID=UPI0039E54B86